MQHWKVRDVRMLPGSFGFCFKMLPTFLGAGCSSSVMFAV